MKRAILMLLVAGPLMTKAQSLKDLLYGGKLKMDSNTVLRKTDDLKAKIDTSQRKPPPPPEIDMAAPPSEMTTQKTNPTTGAPAAIAAAGATGVAALKDSTAGVDTATMAAVPAKTNTKIWKEYSDDMVRTLQTEVLSSKKIKKETYYITVAYEIETNGQVNITNVTATPQNALLEAEVKQRMETTPPQLNPVLDSNNQPRKIRRNYNFSVTKE